jgi:hypothetical protein
MEFTKEHRENLSKALKGRDITWADKIAESMRGNRNAKGQDFRERAQGVYKGFAYTARAERKSDRTWILHLTVKTPFPDTPRVKTSIPRARKVTDDRLKIAYKKVKELL